MAGNTITITRSDGTDSLGIEFGTPGLPGVICMQEWWGVDEQCKIHARRIASAGYHVIIPDFYRGKVGVTAEEAKHLRSKLDWKTAIADMKSTVEYLKSKGAPKVGSIGFCMGGGLAVAAGVVIEDISAAITFYGTPGEELADAKLAKVPVQGHFGALDHAAGFSDGKAAGDMVAKLAEARVPVELYVYPNVGHAFLNDSPESLAKRAARGHGQHDPQAVADAWVRVDAFFARYLKSA